MNYPVWYLPETGGGIMIALIAILHVFVSHFAVGGGLYLIYAEKKGLRERSQPILDFTKRHARFFLLLTMVFGSITGVGIWFIIALVNPAATSLLIHNFVFGWAAEWVFFTVEIVAAFVYYYMFGRMDSSTHLKVGWVYFIAAWMSLFLINGIIGFMLTPGEWLNNNNFWSGFFNPSFWPSLFFRTFVAVMIAACYGYLSASMTSDESVRTEMTRFSAKWALAGLVLSIPAGIWYITVLPEPAQILIFGKSPTISTLVPIGVVAAGLILAVMLAAGIVKPAWNLKPVAIIALLGSFGVIGSFEWIREAARRPYVINEVMYSNSILKEDLYRINKQGFLQTALWAENKKLNEENFSDAGKEIYIQQCYACHTLGGHMNDLADQTRNMSFRALKSYIATMHEKRYFMPPFAGTEKEMEALSAFLVGDVHGKDVRPTSVQAGLEAVPGEAVFDANCAACHVVDDVQGSFADMEIEHISMMLMSLSEISDEMEDFSGTDEERQQLSSFLYGLNSATEKPAPQPTGVILFEENCSACHALEEIQGAFDGITQEEGVEMLATLDEISDEMEPFVGRPGDPEKLAAFLTSSAGTAQSTDSQPEGGK